MPHRLICALVLMLALSSAACGSGAATPGTPTAVVQLACATGSGAVFEQVQASVSWTVLCPAWLPDGMRLVSGGADSNEVRFADEGGRGVSLSQGPGEALYLVRTADGGFATPARRVPFGPIDAAFYAPPAASVVAFDANGIGHSLSGGQLSVDDLLHIARSMMPVSADVARLVTADDTPGLNFEPYAPTLPDPFGQDAENPSACAAAADPGERITAVTREFVVPPPGPAVDYHLAVTHASVVRFASDQAAANYLAGVRNMVAACAPVTEANNATFTVAELDLVAAMPEGGEAIGFSAIEDSGVQQAQFDAAYLRRGELVAIVLREQTLPEGAPPVSTGTVIALAAAAARRLVAG